MTNMETGTYNAGFDDAKRGRAFVRGQCTCVLCDAYADGYAAGTAERLRAADPTATAGEDEDGDAGVSPA